MRRFSISTYSTARRTRVYVHFRIAPRLTLKVRVW